MIKLILLAKLHLSTIAHSVATLVLVGMLMLTTYVRPTTRVQAQTLLTDSLSLLAVQSEQISENQKQLSELKTSIVKESDRIDELERDMARVQGAVIGFGALLSALQMAGLIKGMKKQQ